MLVAHASAGKPSDFSNRTSQSSESAASVTKYAVSVSTTANRRFRRRMRSKADNDSPVLDADVVPPQPNLSQGEALPRRDVKFHPVPGTGDHLTFQSPEVVPIVGFIIHEGAGNTPGAERPELMWADVRQGVKRAIDVEYPELQFAN